MSVCLCVCVSVCLCVCVSGQGRGGGVIMAMVALALINENHILPERVAFVGGLCWACDGIDLAGTDSGGVVWGKWASGEAAA